MDDSKSDIFKAKSIEILNLFYLQSEYKYKFRPELFNELIISKEKLNIFSPRTCKFFKRLVKCKSNKIKKHSKEGIENVKSDFKICKKIQDEQNVNDALQEATVLDKISNLRKKGIWTRDALPKVMEPLRCKGHWDYLLDEIVWMSTDIKSRLNWKMMAAKTLAESAKTYVFVKEEIKTLEFIQIQEEARMKCSRIANMVKEWWRSKIEDKKLDSLKDEIDMYYNVNNIDFFQIWLSESLINAENFEKADFLCDKSGSESLCSFNTCHSHSSIMFTDEGEIMIENSLSLSDNDSHITDFKDELNWLEKDIELNNEKKFSFENEINELNILSQTPIEKIVDENYFLDNDIVSRKPLVNGSDSVDSESLMSEAMSLDQNDIYTKIETKSSSYIVSQSSKIQEILTAVSFTELGSVSFPEILEELLLNETINSNIQVLYELAMHKLSFSVISSLQCGDDRLIISVFLTYLSNKVHVDVPDLIITTNEKISEWELLLKKIYVHCKVIVLDSYFSYKSSKNIFEINQETGDKVVCIISYYCLASQFCVSSTKWNNIIYDQTETLCENSNVSDFFFLSDLTITGIRIGLICEDNNFPDSKHCVKTFFRLFYSLPELEQLLNDYPYENVSKGFPNQPEKLTTVVLNHCVPLQRIIDPENVIQVIMCPLTPFQQTLHKHVVDKLKKSLESNKLLDIVEAISQDILLSQHPYCFDSYSDEGEMELFHSCMKDNKCPPIPVSTFYLSISDSLSIYLPKKIFSTLLSLRFLRNQRTSNYILPFNLCDFSFNKYERCQMKSLLISSTNIDFLLNKVSTCLNDDDEANQNYNVNDLSSSRVSKFQNEDQKEFLSVLDLENLRLELKNFNGVESDNILKHSSLLKPVLQNDIVHSDKDQQSSSTLAARRSKTKLKSRLATLCKENEKYNWLLDCSDLCYTNTAKLVLIDLAIQSDELSCLQHLCSISKKYNGNIPYSTFVTHKVIASRSPRLSSSCKSKSLLTSENQNRKLVQHISKIYQALFDKKPKNVNRDCTIQNEEIELSGKLKILNSILRKLVNDSTVKTCIILSHSFEMLNLIEALLFINNNYGRFLRLRFDSCVRDSDEHIEAIIEKFNKCQFRNRKALLLVHARTNYKYLATLNVDACSIIIADSHWQIDSDQVIFKLINRWGINCIFSQGCGISSIYKLCSFETLEQYFLTNDLSFLYENSYGDKYGLISTTSAIVSQQSLLKYFVDKLFSPLKEELISGFCIENFQSVLLIKTNKLSDESITDVFNSFENAYDLLHLSNYQSRKNRMMNEFNALKEISQTSLLNKKNQIIDKVNYYSESSFSSNTIEMLRKMEFYRIKRQSKLSHLLDLTEEQDLLLSYDQNQLQLNDSEVWVPLQLDDSKKCLQTEILDMYGTKPIRDTELSLYLLPTKNYRIKSNQKKWNDKISSVSNKEDLVVDMPEYLESADRLKKRKLPNEYQVRNFNQYGLNQKKRKIFTNRRYYTDNENDLNSSQNNLKSRYKIEKKSVNDPDQPPLDTKDVDLKKPSPAITDALGDNNISQAVNQPVVPSTNNTTHSTDIGKCNSIILCSNDSSMKINLQRPFYSKDGLKTLKIKRQQISTINISNMNTKATSVTSSSIQNYTPTQRPIHNNTSNHRGQLFLNTKLGSNSESVLQPNGENEYEKLPEWNIHEEAVLFQNISHYQDYPFSTNVPDKSNLSPNFKICEHYLNFYAITNTHRSSEMCNIHFTKLQMGFLNQNKGDNNLSRFNRQSSLSNPTGVLGVRATNESRPMIGGVAGRKLKIKMKNSIGTYGMPIFGSTQAMTNKIKMFQCFLNDMKVNLTQTNQIVNSCLNSFDSKTTMTFKMLDEVVNTSKLPSLLPSHSQTIKKNATHISALEEYNIHPDKIFTPAMLIQRREEMDKERECEFNNLNSNQNRPSQILASASTSSIQSSSSFRNIGYFETTNPTNSSTHSMNHIRRTTSTNLGTGQNLYSLQTTAGNNQVVSRARYNLPINRNISGGGTTVIHQQNNSQIQSTVSAISSNLTSSCNTTVSQNQAASLGSRNQPVQFQIQNNRNSASIPRRTSSQVFQRLVYPGSMHNYPSICQNQIMNRTSSTAFVRPIVPTVVNQSNSQNSTANNSIISVFNNSTHDQSATGVGINRTLERNVNFNISGQIRGHNVRGNITNVSSSGRAGNINQIPRMFQINRNNVNTMGRNQDQ